MAGGGDLCWMHPGRIANTDPDTHCHDSGFVAEVRDAIDFPIQRLSPDGMESVDPYRVYPFAGYDNAINWHGAIFG